MREPDGPVLETVWQWVLKAESDLKTGTHALELGEDCPTDSVCFHAQQCAEKYMKALLVLYLIDFPKTHDLNALARLAPKLLWGLLSDEELRRMTDYATVARYPGDYEEISLAEAKRSVRMARKVRSAVRKLLPKAALARRIN